LPLLDHCHALSSIMTSDIRVHSRHAWSLMNEEDFTHKLHKLGLISNWPEPALICRHCRHALQPSGTRVSKHLAEKHAIPASERKQLVTYIVSSACPTRTSSADSGMAASLINIFSSAEAPRANTVAVQLPLQKLQACAATRHARALGTEPRPTMCSGWGYLAREHAELDTEWRPQVLGCQCQD
jgi:hypothetical protein